MEDKQKVTLAQSVKELAENMPAMLELTALNAKITRKQFMALIEQGFTREEALQVCKK